MAWSDLLHNSRSRAAAADCSVIQPFLEAVNARSAHARVIAVLRVNVKLIATYWNLDLGHEIVERRERKGRAPRGSEHCVPDGKGFTGRNIDCARAFSLAYTPPRERARAEILQHPVAELAPDWSRRVTSVLY